MYQQLSANRPGCVNIHALVGRADDFNGSKARFLSFHTDDAAKKSLSWESGMSAVEGVSVHRAVSSLAAAQNWAAHISRYRAPLGVRAHTLEVRPLAQLLADHGVNEVDFFSLDCEGAERTVLRSLDFARVKVRLLAIETVDPPTRQLLRANGFRDTGFRAALGDSFWVHERHFHEKFGRLRSR